MWPPSSQPGWLKGESRSAKHSSEQSVPSMVFPQNKPPTETSGLRGRLSRPPTGTGGLVQTSEKPPRHIGAGGLEFNSYRPAVDPQSTLRGRKRVAAIRLQALTRTLCVVQLALVNVDTGSFARISVENAAVSWVSLSIDVFGERGPKVE